MTTRTIATVLLTGLVSGCLLDVDNPGALTDDALNEASSMPMVASGVAAELNDLVDELALDVLRLSDEAAGSGSSVETRRLRRGAMDWEETGERWGQVHETLWTGVRAWERMGHPDVIAGGYDRETEADAARVWLLLGFAHRMLGESFCQVVYSVGASAREPALGGVQPRTAAFDSATAAFGRAVTVAGAAGPSAAAYLTAARAGLAQAHAGRGDLARAITYSVQVPTDFVYSAEFHRDVNANDVYVESTEHPQVGLFNSYAANLSGADPRVPYTVCGTFDDPTNPKNTGITPTGASGCHTDRGADGVTAHYEQGKYGSRDADVPLATGVEMRLIEAEAALSGGDLATFTARINDVRSFHGLAPIPAPATAGALEYANSPSSPFAAVGHNAYDASAGNVGEPGVDAWSILDGERHLTLWGEARRLWDLHRWDHPFLAGGIVFWDSEPRRVSCYPVPEVECALNPELSGASLLTGVASATQSCG